MADDIINKLEKLADRYKDGDREMLYEDYEIVCNAWSEIESLRKDVKVRDLQILANFKSMDAMHKELYGDNE